MHDVSRLRRTVFDQRLKPLGITRSQWWVLSNIERNSDEGFSQVELARLLDVGKVTLGGLISRLEKNELVMRVSDTEDRRSKRVKLSSKGAQLLHRVELLVLEVNQQIMEGISTDDEHLFIEILAKMKRNLKVLEVSPMIAADTK